MNLFKLSIVPYMNNIHLGIEVIPNIWGVIGNWNDKYEVDAIYFDNKEIYTHVN
jgi:hypothetical protein